VAPPYAPTAPVTPIGPAQPTEPLKPAAKPAGRPRPRMRPMPDDPAQTAQPVTTQAAAPTAPALSVGRTASVAPTAPVLSVSRTASVAPTGPVAPTTAVTSGAPAKTTGPTPSSLPASRAQPGKRAASTRRVPLTGGVAATARRAVSSSLLKSTTPAEPYVPVSLTPLQHQILTKELYELRGNLENFTVRYHPERPPGSPGRGEYNLEETFGLNPDQYWAVRVSSSNIQKPLLIQPITLNRSASSMRSSECLGSKRASRRPSSVRGCSKRLLMWFVLII
jgi:hypothetical protein